MSTFVPWSVPAFAGVILGIAGAERVAPGLVASVAVGAAIVTLIVAARRPVDRLARLVALASLFAAAGALRSAHDAAWRDPLTPLAGATAELTGRFDGRLLHVTGIDARVALRSADTVPRGIVRVRGPLRLARSLRTPGGFDERAWLRTHRASLLLDVRRGSLVRPEAAGRRRARAALTRGLRPEAAKLVGAMVLGERERSKALRDRFARAGLAHLLALSGLHLGIVAAALGLLLAPLRRARGVVVALAAVAVPFLLGPTPSLVRAAAMTAVVALAVSQGSGRIGPLAALGVAGAASLLARPAWLGDVGFQLSYLSLLGIVAWGVPAARAAATGRSRFDPRAWLGSGLSVSLAAWTAGLPVVASSFGSVALAGPVANLVAVPLATLLVPLGAAIAAAGAVGLPTGPLAGALLGPVAEALVALAALAERVPALPTPAIGGAGTLLFAVAVVPWAGTLRRRFAPSRALLVTSVAVGCWSLLPPAGPLPEWVVLDVGQGDASLIRLPGRIEVLVDGGGTPFGSYDVGAEVVVPALRAMGVDALELVVLSHPDLDHAEGLVAVLRSLPVAALAYGHAAPGEPAWDRLAAVARAEGVPLLPLRRGERLRFGRATLHVLHPTAQPSGETNRDSLVLRLDWRERPWILLAGDVPREVERTLAVPPLPVLLAPHHGSASSTGPALLRAARPSTVAISVGRNRYGHPAEAVLSRLRDAGAEVLRTDRSGTLRLTPTW